MADAELHGAVAGGFGGESVPGWWQRCHWHCPAVSPQKGTMGLLNLSHLPVTQAKLGESVQFLSCLAPHLKVLVSLFQP